MKLLFLTFFSFILLNLNSQTLDFKNKICQVVYKMETNCGKDTVPHSKCDSVSRGLFQITPGAISDVNRHFKTNFTLQDRFNYEKCVLIFFYYQDIYNKSWDLEKAFWLWNAGPSYIDNDLTKKYREKALKLFYELK
jgi:hypothetical protein